MSTPALIFISKLVGTRMIVKRKPMTTESTKQESDVLREQIYISIEKAKAHKNKLKRNSFRYFTANLTLSVLATFLAGTAGIIGNQAGTWKITCLLASAFSIGATVTAKMQTAG